MRLYACLLALALGFISLPAPAADTQTATFSDDFKGVMTSLPGGLNILYPDRSKWAFNFWPGSVWPDSYGDGTNWLEGNGESQTYLSPFIGAIKGRRVPDAGRYNPFTIQADGLHITANLLTPTQQSAYQVGGHRRFGSGLLRSKSTFTYGSFRMIAKLPNARGSWPAFWLLPQARTWPPEMDILEGMAWGPHASQVHVGLLTPNKDPGNFIDWIDVGVDPSKDFHEYGMDWTKDTIKLLFDGRVIAERPTPPSMNQPMYMLINLAVGGKWPCNEMNVHPIDSNAPERLSQCADIMQSDYPAEMIVKSVSVKQN